MKHPAVFLGQAHDYYIDDAGYEFVCFVHKTESSVYFLPRTYIGKNISLSKSEEHFPDWSG